MSRTTSHLRTALVTAAAVCAVAPMAASAAPVPATPGSPTTHPMAKQIRWGGRHSTQLRAVSSASVKSLSFSGACNYFSHANSFGASVWLNPTRFPNGGQVWARYASQKVGSSTPTNYGGWYGPYTVNNYLGTTAPDALGPGVPMYGAQSIPGVSYGYTSGQFWANIQIAVKTPAGFEYTSMWADSYLNSGQYGMSPVNASSCWVSG